MSTLFAFNHTEETLHVQLGGRYDADQQLWVGGNVSVSNVEPEIGCGETLIATTTANVDGKVRNDRIVDNAC